MDDLWWFAEQLGILGNRCQDVKDYYALCQMSTLFARAAGYCESYDSDGAYMRNGSVSVVRLGHNRYDVTKESE